MAIPWMRGRGELARLVDRCERGVQVVRRLEGEHRTLPSRDNNAVEAIEVDLVDGPRVLDELEEGGVVLAAPADHILGLPLAGVLGVAHRVGLAGAALWAEDL